MTMITLHWQRCIKNSLWCQFSERLLNNSRLETRFGDYSIGISGVYIIWTEAKHRTILKVGSGIIKDKLAIHLRDPEVQAYNHSTPLYVTWASTLSVNQPEAAQKGIEKFLGIAFKPKLAERLPDVDPILVNLPKWDKPVPPL